MARWTGGAVRGSGTVAAAMKRSVLPWVIGGTGALALGLVLLRERGEEAALGLQTTLATDTRIPYRARRWAQAVAAAAVKTQPSGVDPVRWGRVLMGKLDRESLGGDALTPKGAAGTGDFAPRRLSTVKAALNRQGKPELADKLRIVRPDPDQDDDFLVVLGDGTGWGRGLSQIDWMSHEFARTGAWRDPAANLAYGAKFLATLYKQFAAWSPRGNIDPMILALDAYNAGAGRVQSAVLAGRNPDSVTTGGDYGTDVYRRVALV